MRFSALFKCQEMVQKPQWISGIAIPDSPVLDFVQSSRSRVMSRVGCYTAITTSINIARCVLVRASGLSALKRNEMKMSTTRCLLALVASMALCGTAAAEQSEAFRYKVPLFGVATVGEADVAPAALSFPDRQIGQPSPLQTVTVTNNGTRNLNFSGVSIAAGAAHFSQSNNCSVLVPGDSCLINVQFTPSAEGSQSGTLALRHDGSTPEFFVSLAGQGRSQSASLSAPTFTATQVGSTSTAAAVLSNTGIGPLSVQTPLVTGAPFAYSSNTCGGSLAAGANCDIEVSFTPTSRAPVSGSLSVNTGAGVKSASLGATGLQGVVSLTPGDLTFALQQLNTTSAAQYVTLTNTGSAPMAVAGVGMLSGASDFNQTNTCGSALGVGDNCLISVAFTPVAAGLRAGSVGFSTDGEGAAQFNVSGTGTPAAVVNSASFTQSIVTSGSPATFNWATSNSVSASVGCSGTTSGTSSGLSGTLVASTSGVGTGSCVVTATNSVGISVTSQAQVTVVAAPAVTSGTFNPTVVRVGDGLNFSWVSRDAVSATVSCTSPAIGSGSGLTGTIPLTTSATGVSTCSVTALNAAGTAATFTYNITVLPAYTYDWATSGYSTPAACGTTTASRSVWCQRSDGATVADGSCSVGTRPSSTTTTSDYSACTYSFTYGGWSTPSGCGSVTATRTATCKRSDGTTVANSNCGTPVTSQSTTSYSSCTYSWSYGSYGSCSASCGGGTQTRSATCYRSDGTAVGSGCGTATTSQSCNTQACAPTYTYSWSYGAWSTPSGCGAVTQTRSATCMRSDGASGGSNCGAVGSTSQAGSDYSGCTYSANLGSWSGCSVSCGGGTQTRSATCTRSDGASASLSSCGSPATSQSCNTQACASYTWKAGVKTGSTCLLDTGPNGQYSGACSTPGATHGYYAGSCQTAGQSGKYEYTQTCS